MHTGTAQLHLCAFAAIHHEHLATHLHQLGGGFVFQGRQGTAASQYVNFEWLHDCQLSRHKATGVLLVVATFITIDAFGVFQIKRIGTESVMSKVSADSTNLPLQMLHSV